MALKGFAFLGDIYPQATLSADGARSLDDEPENVTLLGWRSQVDEASRNIWSSIILQWKQVDLA